MAALTQNRNTPNRTPGSHVDPVASGAQIYSGALVVLNSSNHAEPATKATGLRVRGVAQHPCNNLGGPDAAGSVTTRIGSHLLANAGDITRAHIGSTAYIADDQTVTADSTGSSAAGRIEDIEPAGVWVFID